MDVARLEARWPRDQDRTRDDVSLAEAVRVDNGLARLKEDLPFAEKTQLENLRVSLCWVNGDWSAHMVGDDQHSPALLRLNLELNLARHVVRCDLLDLRGEQRASR